MQGCIVMSIIGRFERAINTLISGKVVAAVVIVAIVTATAIIVAVAIIVVAVTPVAGIVVIIRRLRHHRLRPLPSRRHLYLCANACLIAPLLHIGWLSLSPCRRRCQHHHHDDRHCRRHRLRLVVVVSSLPPS
jgi:hypothetical protein